MRRTAIANGNDDAFDLTIDAALDAYHSRDAERIRTWEQAFDTHVRADPERVE